jgi:hypothetical protein
VTDEALDVLAAALALALALIEWRRSVATPANVKERIETYAA